MKWITALNLQQWMETIPSKTVFPAMVADLIRATATDISGIRFPSGDKGQVRGFDGYLESVGIPPYVPDGLSIWEFGLEGASDSKATKDYNKRTSEVSLAERQRTTLVIVSPRTWDTPSVKIQDWVRDKKALNDWKDVIYLDGSMVENWLEQCPAVAARYAKYELGCAPVTGARSTDEYWEEFSSRFSPALAEQVLLAGREAQASALMKKLLEGSGLLLYAADSPEEVVAFAVAAIRLAEPAVRLQLESKVIIVESNEAARHLSVKKGLVFLPREEANKNAGFLSRSGPTVSSAGLDDRHSSHEVLKRPKSSELGAALTHMGMSESDGYDLARRCGRSLSVLERLKPNGNRPKPEWHSKGTALLPALFAGAWSSVLTDDQDVLCSLGGADKYEVVEAPLRELSILQDSPVEQVGDVWTMRASVDAFIQLGYLIGDEHLSRFKSVAKKVFSKTPAQPKADEVFSPTAAKPGGHSDWLKTGMMNMLLHMAVLHEQARFRVPRSSPEDFVNSIIRELPGLSSDHRLLESLEEQSALLAEAAPIPFLEALERLLEGDASGIKPIFEEHPGFISPRSNHCGVLWGLEVIAWDPALLQRAAKCLARLAAIDPGGRVSNRPINSLRAIFLSWSPNTSAKAEQRNAVLTQIVRDVPEIAWELIEKLLPSWSDIGEVSQKPIFREYANEPEEVLTYGLIWNSQAVVVDLALSLAGQDVERWSLLIGRLSNFPKQSFDAMLVALEMVLEAAEGDTRFKIWDALRKEVNRHITYASADWAFPDEVRAPMEGLLSKYKPQSPIELTTWLFDDWMPDVPERKDEGKDITEAIDEARSKALISIFDSKGIQGLLELATKVKLPQHVALSMRTLELSFDDLFQALELSLTNQTELDAVSGILLLEGTTRFGERWLTKTRELLLSIVKDRERLARLLMSLDESKDSWAYVASFGDEIRDTYWRKKHSYFIQGASDDLQLAIDNYLACGRPMAAIDASSNRFADVSSSLLLRFLDEAIDEINSAGPNLSTMHEYNIERVFEELAKRSDISSSDVAQREFAYLPIFRHREKGKPLTLHRLMVEQPTLFIDAIKVVFRPKGVELPAPTKAEQRRAVAAYELLESLHVLPGQTDLEVHSEKLLAWCNDVRKLANEANLAEITDIRIGHLLAHSPASNQDGAWPHESVRLAIESLASGDIEHGLSIERFNMRGVYSKSLGEGGAQERGLAEQSKGWAKAMPSSPRTAAMLMQISESWMREAERADISGEKEAIRW